MQKYTLEEFKAFIVEERKKDIIDISHGIMKIHRCNINKYLEKYMCRDEEDLDETLYKSYGIWLSIID